MHRRLGQHFLRSKRIIHSIASSLETVPETTVVEIGAGKGVLTSALLDRYKRVIAIEKDPSLCSFLHDHFSSAIDSGALTVVSSDVRDTSWYSYVHTIPYVVIANIPFYITGSLIRSLLSATHYPQALSLVVQKEVAKRIVEQPSSHSSLLSLSVQLFCTPRYLFTIPRRDFSPPPAVDSALLGLFSVDPPPLPLQETFFSLIHIAFHEKRKTVLKKFSAYPAVHALLIEKGVTPLTRAEEISFPVWFSVADHLTNSNHSF